ncbi:hypothetical protein PHISCL_08145 [Aspergillus sclerotialis]|uniref:Plus3 domain-containing protein n=1 Tax=Aspergillus sclerotialis TaxID=2070753 RepID=A0A3A2ZR05_9EURO|nr:hypothetical protein PHISCL_08145 [Aspergillus sclerotialis]
MADDLDAELLALAGDDASDEETTPPKSKQQPDSHPVSSSPRSPGPSSTMDRKGRGKSSRRGRKSRDDDEDGELSDAESHHSLQSASMSESDSASDASEVEDDGPIFPYDKLYYSSEDKQRIMGLPEIQREEILSERAQQVDRHNQDRALRRLLASRERESARAAKKSKRKASSAGLDDGQRKSSRQKMTLGGRKVGETSGAMAAYKRQREQKGRRDELRRRDPVAKDHRAKLRPIESEADLDLERSPSTPKDDPPADLKDIQRARVGRSNFAQVCFYPGFDDAISGCYSRVNIGPNRETGQNEYRMCLIKKFTEGRPYAMEGANGRSFVTTQYAVLAHGKAEREFPFIACSDSPFTEAEFNRYRQTMAVEDCVMATKPMLANKVADINRLLNHKFTNEELNEKLRKQGTFDTKMLVFKRMETERKLQMARAYGDKDEIEALEAQMQEFSAPKLAFGTTLSKPRSEKKTEQERLAELNLRNQKLNYEHVRRAEIEERRAARKAAAAIARGGTTDPSRDGTPLTGPDSPAKSASPRGSTPLSSQKSANKGPTGMIRYRNNDDENIAALDIELDIEI